MDEDATSGQEVVVRQNFDHVDKIEIRFDSSADKVYIDELLLVACMEGNTMILVVVVMLHLYRTIIV